MSPFSGRSANWCAALRSGMRCRSLAAVKHTPSVARDAQQPEHPQCLTSRKRSPVAKSTMQSTGTTSSGRTGVRRPPRRRTSGQVARDLQASASAGAGQRRRHCCQGEPQHERAECVDARRSR
ncbi:hypothetical protein IF2G_03336 [Cordyceps javanica]|nr:hypothetical protein IF2G_03336 [Cordyceps javanica]